MLLVNLQLATTSTVDGFQPVIEVAVTHKKAFFFLIIIETYCTVITMSVKINFEILLNLRLNLKVQFI